MRQNIDLPVDLTATADKPDSLPLESRLAFVQVGIWEVRRRWLAGETADLGRLLACLDEDVEMLRSNLTTADDDSQAVATMP